MTRLFGESSDYEQLDKRKALTLAKKDHLLMVLSHPKFPCTTILLSWEPGSASANEM